MKNFIPMWAFALAFLGLVSCGGSDDVIETLPEKDKVTLNDPINSFIWQGMNSWYNWKADSDKLADNKDDDLEEYYTFLNGYNDYRDLMYDLCYKHHTIVGRENAVDKDSWFIDDYEEQEKLFQGVTTSFGFRYQPVKISDTDVILYLEIVTKNSPADLAGFKRGDIINGLNGTQITADNYSTVLSELSNDMVTFSFIKAENNELTQLDDKTISRAENVDEPVNLYKIFNDIGGKKVGYLVYTGFRFSYHSELNEVFAFFKSEGIDELVLDLRFNGGGTVITSAYLSSMIYGAGGTQDYAEIRYNQNHTEENYTYTFEDKMFILDADANIQGEENINRLSKLNNLYVLVSDGSASASEMLINGLKPYMSFVKLIGTTTYGKNVGSITLYDSPSSDFQNKPLNKDHKFAMQPIVFQSYNSVGESDFGNGFSPDIEVKEWYYWDDIKPLGDENEVLLKTALDDIRGVVSKVAPGKDQTEVELLKFESKEDRFAKELYLVPDFKRLK